MTTTLERVPVSLGAAREDEQVRAKPGFWRTWLLDRPEVTVLGALALVGYVIGAWVLRYHFGYAINDALARTAKPVYMAVSRDPHLGAVGFYWPPLQPTLEIPFVMLLRPFGHMDFAGPVTSALWLGLSGVVLGRICAELGLKRLTTLLLCVLFLANPVMVVYAINGMSESCLYFFLLVAMLGWLRWVRRRDIADLALIGVAMACAIMVRIETLPIVGVLAVAVGASRDWRTWSTRAVAVAVPPAFIFGCWLGVQWILLKDPLAFLHFKVPGNGQKRSAAFLHAFALPVTNGNYLRALPWALTWVAVLAPTLIVFAIAAVAWRRQYLYAAAGILGTAAVFPLVQIYLIVHNTGFGDARYFTSLIPLAFVSAALMSSALWSRQPPPEPIFRRPPTPVEGELPPEEEGPPSRWWGRLAPAALLCGLAATAVVSMAFMLNGNRTRIGNEHYLFRVFLGRPVARDTTISQMQKLAAYLDPYLAKGQHAILDTSFGYAPLLFTHHPNGFIIQEDRDFRPILDSPDGRFQFVVQPPTQDGVPDVLGALLQPADAWKLVGVYGTLKLWHLQGAPATASP